ncbi:MAG: acetylglutamate kinase [Candidatus Woykebacteria bacterium]
MSGEDPTRKAQAFIGSNRGKVIVAKYGGSALGSPTMQKVLEVLVLFARGGVQVVLVHGGGAAITTDLKKAGLHVSFQNGLRGTTAEMMVAITKTLERTNQILVDQIRGLGGKARSFVPHHKLITAKRHEDESLGLVGHVMKVRGASLRSSLTRGEIAVVSPVGWIWKQDYNINADEAAAAVAIALKADCFLQLTDVPAVMINPLAPRSLVHLLNLNQAKRLLSTGIAQGGMIPKIEACIQALEGGVGRVYLLEATQQAILAQLVEGKPVGTEFVRRNKGKRW